MAPTLLEMFGYHYQNVDAIDGKVVKEIVSG
jgi:hypothetical protein